jgi:DNA repair protein RadC
MPAKPAKKVDIVSVRLVRESSVPYAARRVNGPEEAVAILRPFLEGQDRENFVILCLDTKNKPTAIHTVSVGTVNSSLIHPREVFKAAILANASAIVLAHNHPSGDPMPSSEDKEVTVRLKKAGEILGISVLDHLIIGHNDFFSFAGKRLL